MISYLLRRKRKKYVKNDSLFGESKCFRNGKMDNIYKSDLSEDAYINNSSGKEIIGSSFNFAILPFVYCVLIFFIFLLLGRTAWLQIVKGEYYYSMSEGNRIRIHRIEPKRGVIYDRNNTPLVRNKANFMLYFIPADLPEDKRELDEIINQISILTPVSFDEIKEILGTIDLDDLEAYRPLFITDNISYESALKLFLKADGWSGVIMSSKFNREYLNVGKIYFYGEDFEKQKEYLSLSHILGYTGKINNRELEKVSDEYLPIDYIGKMGVEYFWENELRGTSGKKKVEVDVLGKEKKILGQVEANDGHNLILSLDIKMQEKMEEILISYLDKIEPTRASVIVMNPNNGEILTMVSLPSYNNNQFARGINREEYNQLIENVDRPLFNRSISGEFPSGSTIKLVMAAAALQERIVSENTYFLSTGGIRVGQWFFPDWKAGGHGRTDVRKAIAQSVNTYFYIIGGGHNDFVGLGIDRIVKYYKLFGLGSQFGIDLAGEADGLVPTKEWKREAKNESWYIGDTYHVSIGQGDLIVTPLQVAVYTSFFANKGKIYRPHFVKQILDSNDKVIRDIENIVISEGFIDDYNIMVVRQGMRQAVTQGSARSLKILPVEAAGKTGTAQWHSKKKPHAWFTSFAPYDKAEIVVTVLVEEGEEGSTVATPIAREFMMWYFNEYKPRDR